MDDFNPGKHITRVQFEYSDGLTFSLTKNFQEMIRLRDDTGIGNNNNFNNNELAATLNGDVNFPDNKKSIIPRLMSEIVQRVNGIEKKCVYNVLSDFPEDFTYEDAVFCTKDVDIFLDGEAKAKSNNTSVGGLELNEKNTTKNNENNNSTEYISSPEISCFDCADNSDNNSLFFDESIFSSLEEEEVGGNNYNEGADRSYDNNISAASSFVVAEAIIPTTAVNIITKAQQQKQAITLNININKYNTEKQPITITINIID